VIYSVFNWGTGRYRYYEGDGEGLGVRPRPRVVANDPGGKGRRLEDLLPVLPANARSIGEGDEPRGRLAVVGDGTLALDGISVSSPYYFAMPLLGAITFLVLPGERIRRVPWYVRVGFGAVAGLILNATFPDKVLS